MASVLQHKVVSALPAPLDANAIYYVRVGAGFDIYVTNDQGTVVSYPINNAKAGANSDITSLRAAQYIDKTYVNAAATGTVTLDLSVYSIFDLTLTGATTLVVSNFPSLTNETLNFLIRVTSGGTVYTLNWFSGITWLVPGGSVPTAPLTGKVAEFVMSSQNGTATYGRRGPAN